MGCCCMRNAHRKACPEPDEGKVKSDPRWAWWLQGPSDVHLDNQCHLSGEGEESPAPALVPDDEEGCQRPSLAESVEVARKLEAGEFEVNAGCVTAQFLDELKMGGPSTSDSTDAAVVTASFLDALKSNLPNAIKEMFPPAPPRGLADFACQTDAIEQMECGHEDKKPQLPPVDQTTLASTLPQGCLPAPDQKDSTQDTERQLASDSCDTATLTGLHSGTADVLMQPIRPDTQVFCHKLQENRNRRQVFHELAAMRHRLNCQDLEVAWLKQAVVQRAAELQQEEEQAVEDEFLTTLTLRSGGVDQGTAGEETDQNAGEATSSHAEPGSACSRSRRCNAGDAEETEPAGGKTTDEGQRCRRSCDDAGDAEVEGRETVDEGGVIDTFTKMLLEHQLAELSDAVVAFNNTREETQVTCIEELSLSRTAARRISEPSTYHLCQGTKNANSKSTKTPVFGEMDILVTDTDGLPADATLMVKVGACKRQVTLARCMDQPMQIQYPLDGSDPIIQLSVTQTIATAKLALHPSKESYFLRMLNTTDKQPVVLRLCIQGHDCATHEACPGCDPEGRQAYLKVHAEYIGSLMQIAVSERADDPYLVMYKQLEAVVAGDGGQASEESEKDRNKDSPKTVAAGTSEVTVLLVYASGLQEDNMVSIRIGSVRRKTTIASLRSTGLQFPAASKSSRTLVDLRVLQVPSTGCAQIQDVASVSLSNRTSQHQFVEFRALQRGQSFQNVSTTPFPQASTNLAATGPLLPAEGAAAVAAPRSSHPSEVQTVDDPQDSDERLQYFSKHDLKTFARDLLLKLAARQPKDPCLFMLQQLQKKVQSGMEVDAQHEERADSLV